MSDTESVHGTCGAVEIKNGWHVFKIDIGKQYPVSLSTKKPSLVEQAMAVGAAPAEWVYVSKESDKINEHTGKPYVNRWLEEVHVGGSPAAAKPQAPAAQQAGRNESIERQTVAKAALAQFPAKAFATKEAAIATMDWVFAWVSQTTPQAPAPPAPEEVKAAVPGSSFVADDDDIPF